MARFILMLFLFITSSIEAQLVFIGDGSQTAPNCAEITPDDYNQKGWVYSSTKVDLSVVQNFSYEINLGSHDNDGADGMVFMLHNDPRGLGAQGCVGESMGYANHPFGSTSAECGYGSWYAIQPSIAVEFDTYQNSTQGDPAADHVALLENGNVNHGSNYISLSNIEDGQGHTFVLNWDPSTQNLEVILDGNTLISKNQDIINEIFGGQTLVYWGFSASTGGAKNSHSLCVSGGDIVIIDNISVQNGDWNNPATWAAGVPTSGTDAVVAHSVSLSSNEDVSSLTVEAGGVLNLGARILNISGNELVLKGEVTSSGGELFFSSGTSQSISLPNGPRTVENIRVNGEGLSILANTLNIYGYLNVESGTVNTNNLLTLTSTPSSSGNILDLSNGTINGNVSIYRDITLGTDAWRYITSPFSDLTVADLQTAFPVSGNFTGSNLIFGLSKPSLFEYDESKLNVLDTGYVAYPNGVSAGSANLTAGKGYAAFVTSGSHIMNLTGKINEGQQLIYLSYTNSGSDADDGWNLIGNPYPCTFDWENLSSRDKRRINNAVYYNDNTSGSLVKRSYVNGVGNPSGTTGEIAPYQAFWVQATRSGARVTLNEDDKVNSFGNYYRTAAPKLIRMRLSDANQTNSETVIRIEETATESFDAEFDAYLFSPSGLTINTLDSLGNKMSINAINSENTKTIALQIQGFKYGTYTLDFFEKSWEIEDAYLLDAYTGEEIALNKNTKYEFDIVNAPKSIYNRFKIRFGKAKEVGINDVNIQNTLHLYPNPTNQGSDVSANLNIKSYVVYDINGGLVKDENDLNGSQIFTNDLEKGFYLFKIVDDEGNVFNSKLVIE